MVYDGYQVDEINFFSFPNRWKNRSGQQDDCAYHAHVKIQPSAYMGQKYSIC